MCYIIQGVGEKQRIRQLGERVPNCGEGMRRRLPQKTYSRKYGNINSFLKHDNS